MRVLPKQAPAEHYQQPRRDKARVYYRPLNSGAAGGAGANPEPTFHEGEPMKKLKVLKKDLKLTLSRETLRTLEEQHLLDVNGCALTRPYIQCTGTGTMLC